MNDKMLYIEGISQIKRLNLFLNLFLQNRKIDITDDDHADEFEEFISPFCLYERLYNSFLLTEKEEESK